MEKKITAEDIKRELIAQLKGKEAEDARWKVVNVIREMVKPILEERGYDAWSISLDSQNSSNHWIARIALGSYGICDVSIKRKRGAYHHYYFGNSHYEWAAEDFDVSFCYLAIDAEEAIARAINAKKDQDGKIAVRQARAKEIAKLVMDKYNVNWYEANQILMAAKNHTYLI